MKLVNVFDAFKARLTIGFSDHLLHGSHEEAQFFGIVAVVGVSVVVGPVTEPLDDIRDSKPPSTNSCVSSLPLYLTAVTALTGRSSQASSSTRDGEGAEAAGIRSDRVRFSRRNRLHESDHRMRPIRSGSRETLEPRA